MFPSTHQSRLKLLSTMTKTIYVKDFGVVADGINLDTMAVQRAVDACEYGGTVLFTKGTYRLSTVFLKSGVTIKFQSGTKILGAEKLSDYASDEKITYPLYQDISHSCFHCSLFVAENCSDITIYGKATIDMCSVWDDDNIRNNAHRGAKCIALKNCKNVRLEKFTIQNATDLAVYFAGCSNVYVGFLKLRVYIDGISPDNSHNVLIENCKLLCGDDAIVLKSSYTLNRIEVCDSITVRNCDLQSRCNAIKFGTETNGGFHNILIENIKISNTRISGVAIESVDGGSVDNLTIQNVSMKNVNAPLFIHLGNRLRGPEGSSVGGISNVTLKDIVANGPYKPYKTIEWNFASFLKKDTIQYPWIFGKAENFDDNANPLTKKDAWQMTSNVCGLQNHPLRNIKLENISLNLNGGVKNYKRNVPEVAQDYPEVYVYGRILPAKGVYFRYIDGLKLINCSVTTKYFDVRENFIFDEVVNLDV